MGCWDELCLLCGVGGGGPGGITGKYSVEEDARKCASELVATQASMGMDEEELYNIVLTALRTTVATSTVQIGNPSWMPEGLGSDAEVTADPKGYTTWRDVAVGYFDKESGEGTALTREGRLAPDGKNTRVRQVVDCYAADYSSVVCRAIAPSGKEIEVQRQAPTRCSVVHGFSPNIALDERCYYYLKFWRDASSLPPPADSRNLSFAGELYEIVNSRKKLRGE